MPSVVPTMQPVQAQKSRETLSSREYLLSNLRVKDASSLVKEIFSLNKTDYTPDYFKTTRVLDFLSWVEKNSAKLTLGINNVLEANKEALLAAKTIQTHDFSKGPINLDQIFSSAIISPSDTAGRLLVGAAREKRLLSNACIGLIGAYLGSEYIASRYLRPEEFSNKPKIIFAGDNPAYYSSSNTIGISLSGLCNSYLQSNSEILTFFISSIYSGGHEGAHGIAVFSGQSDKPLSELATYIAGADYLLPTKSKYVFQLWNMPILIREQELSKQDESSIVNRTDVLKSFYLIQFMGPWVHSWLKKESTPDITKFTVDPQTKEITAYELYSYYLSGALVADGARLEAEAFCQNSGIFDKELTSKIILVFEKFRDKMDSKKSYADPEILLLNSLDEVFGKQKIPQGVPDTFGAVYKKSEEFLS